MSGPVEQEQRKAGYIADALESVKESKPDHQRIDEVEAEGPWLGDDHKLAAIAADMAEQVATLTTALNHLVEHVIPGQDKTIEGLQKRVDKPQGDDTAKPKARAKKR